MAEKASVVRALDTESLIKECTLPEVAPKLVREELYARARKGDEAARAFRVGGAELPMVEVHNGRYLFDRVRVTNGTVSIDLKCLGRRGAWMCFGAFIFMFGVGISVPDKSPFRGLTFVVGPLMLSLSLMWVVNSQELSTFNPNELMGMAILAPNRVSNAAFQAIREKRYNADAQRLLKLLPW